MGTGTREATTFEGADAEAEAGLRARAAATIPKVVHAPEATDDSAGYERSAASVLRLISSLLLALIVLALAELLPEASHGLESDLEQHAGSWAGSLGELAGATATAWSVALIIVTIVAAAVAHRPRAIVTSCVAGAITAAAIVLLALETGTSPGTVNGQEVQLAVVGAGVAMSATAYTLFAMPIPRWSIAGISVLTVVGVLAGEVSLASRLALLLGSGAIGSAVALAFGVPSRRIGRRELLDALNGSRLVVTDIDVLATDARGSQPWIATSATGRRLFVKVEAVDELRDIQLFRLWRVLRLKDPEDGSTPRSFRQHSEHEAFVAQRAQVAGVLTPSILAIGDVADGRGVFTVFEMIEGVTLDRADELSDAAVRSAWSQIQVMRRAGISHRDLRAANLMCVDDAVWVIDFGAAEVAPSDALLERDVAEFLASTAALIGAERAVDNAVAVLGADDVATSIPWLQPLAVTTATRNAVPKAQFEELRERVRSAAGISAPELPQLQRITWRGLAIFAVLGIAVWTLLPQLTSGVDWSATLEANRGWAAIALVASALTYVGAAVSMAGSVTDRLSIGPTILAQLASSFTNRVTPAKVGGIALNLRFLVKQGIEKARAATAIGVSTAVGTIVHVAVTLVVVVWAGDAGLPGVSLPSSRVMLLIAAAVAVAIVVIAAVPPARRWWTGSMVPSLRRSWTSCVEVMRSPRLLLMVAGGSLIVTMGNLVAFVVSIGAFGVEESFTTLAIVYLAGSALASAAPTPGGLGATEAALVAGLAVVGVSENEAIPGVLLFRLATFWIPILPGWLSLTVLQHRGDL